MDDDQQQRDKADQELLDGAESGVYLPEQAGEPVNAPHSAKQARAGQQSDDEQPDGSQSDDDQKPETLSQKIYAIVFLTVFLAILGGVVCAWLGQAGLAKQYLRHRHLETDPGVFRLLEDWRVEFAIGAAIGAVSGIVFCIRFWTGREDEWKPPKNDGLL